MTADELAPGDMDIFGHAFDDEPSFITDDGCSPTDLSAATPTSDDFDIALPVDSHEQAVSLTEPHNVGNKQEMEADTAKSAWQRDQAQKWAALPAWMFEEYGDIVDLID